MWFKPKIEHQKDEFVNHKLRTKSPGVAFEHKIWLDHFTSCTKIKSVTEINESHIEIFAAWLDNHVNGAYTISKASNSLNQFLKYYKMKQAVKLRPGPGRNEEMTEAVQKLRAADMTFRDIQDYFLKKKGIKYDLKSLLRWSRYER